MAIEFDEGKDTQNIERHGLSFVNFTGFDSEPLVLVDDRRDYGEVRYRAFGRIGGMGHMIVYTVRGEHIRLISFRRAHEREMRRHDR